MEELCSIRLQKKNVLYLLDRRQMLLLRKLRSQLSLPQTSLVVAKKVK